MNSSKMAQKKEDDDSKISSSVSGAHHHEAGEGLDRAEAVEDTILEKACHVSSSGLASKPGAHKAAAITTTKQRQDKASQSTSSKSKAEKDAVLVDLLAAATTTATVVAPEPKTGVVANEVLRPVPQCVPGEFGLSNMVSGKTSPEFQGASEPTAQDESSSTTGSGPQRRVMTPGAWSIQGMDRQREEPSEVRDEIESVASNDVETALQVEQHHVVEAVAVQDQEAERRLMEAEIRDTIIRDAVQANVVPNTSGDQSELDLTKETQPEQGVRKRTLLCPTIALLLILAVGLGLGLGLGLNKDDDNSNTGAQDRIASSPSPSASQNEEIGPIKNKSTLEIVQERGYVRCGMNDLAFAQLVNSDVSDELEGFHVEQCQAVAFLALGDSSKYEQVWVTPYSRFELLADRSIDLITEGTTFNMERDVYQGGTKASFTFTTPYFYSGLTFGGVPAMVDCADAGEDFYEECRALQICVAEGTTHIVILREILPGGLIVPYNGTNTLMDSLHSGKCNVVASEPGYLSHVGTLYQGEEWKMGSKSFSKEPLSLTTRQEDPQWSTLVNMVVEAFLLAEAHGISRDNADEFKNLAVEDSAKDTVEFASVFASLISEFGHHGDLYHEYIGWQIPRNGLNHIYDMDQSSGLLYSLPFGQFGSDGRPPINEGGIDTILKRGHLLCGVHTSRGSHFASVSSAPRAGDVSNPVTTEDTWSGFDVVFCHGIAASLFGGDGNKIIFVELHNNEQAYSALSNKEVDVVAGARVTLQAMHKEPSTRQMFAFSTPSFYDNESHDAFAFMTLQDDPQWTDFVNWNVQAVIYAEEQGITSAISADMPVVELFGEQLKQMFRDCIAQVGNYGELYNSILQDHLPRSGANRLNEGMAGPQLFPVPLF